MPDKIRRKLFFTWLISLHPPLPATLLSHEGEEEEEREEPKNQPLNSPEPRILFPEGQCYDLISSSACDVKFPFRLCLASLLTVTFTMFRVRHCLPSLLLVYIVRLTHRLGY